MDRSVPQASLTHVLRNCTRLMDKYTYSIVNVSNSIHIFYDYYFHKNVFVFVEKKLLFLLPEHIHIYTHTVCIVLFLQHIIILFFMLFKPIKKFCSFFAAVNDMRCSLTL